MTNLAPRLRSSTLATLRASPVASTSRLTLPLIASQRRLHSTTSSPSVPLASDAYTRLHPSVPPSATVHPVDLNPEATTSAPRLSPRDRKTLESMLRVDHAGEVAANTIYQAQAEVFGKLGDERTKKMMLEMWETEKKHLAVAKKLLKQHGVAPSALLPVWSLAGSVLGGVTALLGKEAAMACTEAVETVIGEHYDDQLVHLNEVISAHSPAPSTPSEASSSSVPATAGAAHPSLPLLASVIREFRDDELEHLDVAVEHDAQQAPAHALLSAVVGFGCKGAIEIAKRF